jgi:hypothetical protein
MNLKSEDEISEEVIRGELPRQNDENHSVKHDLEVRR